MNRGTYFWGGLLVLIGVLFLLSNLGLLGNINIWSVIGPLFLILLGLWFIFGILIRPDMKSEPLEIPLRGSRSAKIHIKHGAGRLRISSDASSSNLLEGTFQGGVDRKQSGQDDHTDLTLSLPQQFMFWGWRPNGFEWEIKLNTQVLLELDVNFGAGESNLNLKGLDVSRLDLKTGASSNEVTLPSREGNTLVRIESGVSSVNVHVPQDVAAWIKTEAGLAGVTIDQNRFPRQGGIYQTSGYESARRKVELRISTGVSSIDIR